MLQIPGYGLICESPTGELDVGATSVINNGNGGHATNCGVVQISITMITGNGYSLVIDGGG